MIAVRTAFNQYTDDMALYCRKWPRRSKTVIGRRSDRDHGGMKLLSRGFVRYALVVISVPLGYIAYQLIKRISVSLGHECEGCTQAVRRRVA